MDDIEFLEIYEDITLRFDSPGWRAIAVRIVENHPSLRKREGFEDLASFINAYPHSRLQALQSLRVTEDRRVTIEETVRIYLWFISILTLKQEEFERLGGREAAMRVSSSSFLESKAEVGHEELKLRIQKVRLALDLWDRKPGPRPR